MGMQPVFSKNDNQIYTFLFSCLGVPGSSPSLPTLNTTPLFNRTKDSKLRTPFKVPFIDRLKKAT